MRILVLNNTRTELEQWIGALRRAGHEPVCHFVNDESDLLSALEERWDMILNEGDPFSTIDRMRRLNERLRSTHESLGATIARRLHDDVGQSLTRIKIDLSLLGKKLQDSAAHIDEEVATMGKEIDALFDTIREITSKCRKGIPKNLELSDVIVWHAREFETDTGIKCAVLDDSGPAEIDGEIARTIVGILDEALANVADHSGATEALIRLNFDGDDLVLVVEDNGRGIREDQIASPRSTGLFQMRELALGKKGTIVLNGISGGGTTLKAVLPSDRKVKELS